MVHSKIRISTILFLGLFLTNIAFILRASGQANTEEITDLEGINVAVYNGIGAVSHCTTALASLFEWLNASVDRIRTESILNGSLEDYEIVAYPGGNMLAYATELGNNGTNIIRDFVSNGGSYVGICGGSMLACEYGLGLFNGTIGPAQGSGTVPYLINMTVNRECEGPDLSDLPGSYMTMYWASRSFIPLEGSEVYPIATYGVDGDAGMIAFRYGNGTVFISSPHPEYEEGSDRDGTVFSDSLDDPDSEYELLRRVMVWLIEESYITPESSTTDSGITTMLLGSIGVTAIVVVLVAIVYYKKRR